MTLPSTEELQRLLRRTTPIPWEIIREPYRAADEGHQVTVQVGPFEHVEDDGQHFICSGWDEDADLAALAPDLAAEVIRLREENERLTRIEWLAEQAAESDSGLAYDLDQINGEYEGGQA